MHRSLLAPAAVGSEMVVDVAGLVERVMVQVFSEAEVGLGRLVGEAGGFDNLIPLEHV